MGDLRLKTDALIFVGADAVILPFTSLKKMLTGKVKGTHFATTFSNTNWRISQLEPGDNVWSIPAVISSSLMEIRNETKSYISDICNILPKLCMEALHVSS